MVGNSLVTARFIRFSLNISWQVSQSMPNNISESLGNPQIVRINVKVIKGGGECPV